MQSCPEIGTQPRSIRRSAQKKHRKAPSPSSHRPKQSNQVEQRRIELEEETHMVTTYDPYQTLKRSFPNLLRNWRPRLAAVSNDLLQDHPDVFKEGLCTPESLAEKDLCVWDSRVKLNRLLKIPHMAEKARGLLLETLLRKGGKYMVVPDFRAQGVTITRIETDDFTKKDVLFRTDRTALWRKHSDHIWLMRHDETKGHRNKFVEQKSRFYPHGTGKEIWVIGEM